MSGQDRAENTSETSDNEDEQTTSENGGEEQTTSEDSGDEQTSDEGRDDGGKDEDDVPELSDEGKEQVRKMRAAYDDEKPTAVMPGTDRTITGTAVNEWLDDDGNPKFGKDEGDQASEESEDDGESSEHAHDDGESSEHAHDDGESSKAQDEPADESDDSKDQSEDESANA